MFATPEERHSNHAGAPFPEAMLDRWHTFVNAYMAAHPKWIPRVF